MVEAVLKQAGVIGGVDDVVLSTQIVQNGEAVTIEVSESTRKLCADFFGGIVAPIEVR